jgi:phenylalanyl-tRNA synthetase beta chain
VPCALPGAVLPGGLKIAVSKVRGVESFGMLCSARELGIAEDAAGLLVLSAEAPVGEDIRRHLDLDDRLLTLKLTPNRADCLSLEGVAREVAALTATPATLLTVDESR